MMEIIQRIAMALRINYTVNFGKDFTRLELMFQNIGWASPRVSFRQEDEYMRVTAEYVYDDYGNEVYILVPDFFVGCPVGEVQQVQVYGNSVPASLMRVNSAQLSELVAWVAKRMEAAKLPDGDDKMFY